MEVREFAERVLFSEEIESKLRAPELPLTDERPGPPERIWEPSRPDPLRFAPRKQAAKMPHRSGFWEPRLRAVAHHIMANHELQALEVMAWTILAFPDAPTRFRRGIVGVMLDEQRHTRMHLKRLDAFGMELGDLPVNGHVWIRSRQSENVLDYL
ncbi:MAG: DUF455 family protein, partial [Planctomycetaceae bacterium]|nr:DUF455 family protein [Planctomycetaceae bacterium]